MMVLARLGPSTATTSTASTRLGTAMIRSMNRVTATSKTGPAIAATSPSATPTMKDTHITERPMNSDTRAPKMRRDSMSWPSPSVPSTKRQEPPFSHTGGARTASRNCSIGEWGATKSAVSARRTITAKTARPNNAPRFSRNAAQNDASGEGCARTAAASSPTGPVSATSAAMADPGIDDSIDEIDDQIDEDDDGGDEQNAALKRWIVAPANGIDEPMADAWPGEDRLCQHGARHQARDRKADHRHHRQKRVAQGVNADDPAGRQPFGARGAHVILAQDFEHRGASHAGDDGERHGAEHDRRQDEVPHGV